MTPEERAELERELAAELEALALGGEDDDEEDEPQTEYVRLNLAVVLHDVAQKDETTTSRDEDNSTWSRLMESVAHCETVVFRAFDQEMEELQTRILPQMKALTGSVNLERHAEVLETANQDPAATSLQVSTVIPHVVEPQAAPVEAWESLLQIDTTKRTPGRASGRDFEPKAVGNPPELVEAPTPAPDPIMGAGDGVRAANEEIFTVSFFFSEPSVPVPDPEESIKDRGEKLQADAEQVAERESARLQAQLHAQRAQRELEVMMATMAAQWEQEQSQHDQKLREASSEREARAAMDKEEKTMRFYMDARRQAQEVAWMQQEDILSQTIEGELAQERQREAMARQQMAQEESRTWRVLRQQRETQRKEKLVEEQSRLRRWHHRVMEELVCVIATRAETKRRVEEVERRRVQRELSAMRSEEHWMRRLLVEERAWRDDQRRQQNRIGMEIENALASRIRDQKRQHDECKRQRAECASMGSEEQRSRVWETVWRMRMKRLRKVLKKRPQWELRQRWEHWCGVVVECQQREAQQRVSKIRHTAARLIQRCVVRYVDTIRAVRLKEAQEAHTEATQAARVVQSAFRGFHVRRKFQNALDMAKTMDFDGEDEFGEVNLDDLIQAPPELDEDWGMPTMPQRHLEPERGSDVEEDDEDDCEESDEEDGHEEVDEETAREEHSRFDPAQHARAMTPKVVQQPPQAAEGGGNLAAQLWNRMRNKTLKRQHVQEEKKRQQDPEYRAKKILGKPTHIAPSQSSNQHQQQLAVATTVSTTVSWATNTDKKKAPKVKLPSLVERLRKTTAAAR